MGLHHRCKAACQGPAPSCSRTHCSSVLFSKQVHGLQGQDGVAQINFPNSAKGFRDFILVDEEVQVTVGNRGSVVVIRKK